MFRKISEGDVFVCGDGRMTSGPRVAVLPDGRLICTFMLNSESGANDFVPMAAWSDDGESWSEAKELYPELVGKKSVFVSARNTLDGRVSLGGKAWDIAHPGEHFWSDEAGGMKENRLVYAIGDDGVSFPALEEIDVPFYASAENPGGAFVDADGTVNLIYSPYPTIEKRGETDTRCMVRLTGREGGEFSAEKFAVVGAPSLYAESWLDRLSDGRLFVSTWQTASEDSSQFFVSGESGALEGPFAQPFHGQSTGICTDGEGGVYIAYNQRKASPVGVWLAYEKPTVGDAGMIANEPVWIAGSATKSGTSGDFAAWTDFSFGEPHVKLLSDGTLIVVLWYKDGDKIGVRYVRLIRE